jgi:hypothetical protein
VLPVLSVFVTAEAEETARQLEDEAKSEAKQPKKQRKQRWAGDDESLLQILYDIYSSTYSMIAVQSCLWARSLHLHVRGGDFDRVGSASLLHTHWVQPHNTSELGSTGVHQNVTRTLAAATAFLPSTFELKWNWRSKHTAQTEVWSAASQVIAS